MSVKEYAIKYIGQKTENVAVGLGGNAVLATGVHALDGPEHTGQLPADRVSYDNATSGLTATDAQAAIDELAATAATAGPVAVVEHGSLGATETFTFAPAPDDPTTPTEGPVHAGTLTDDLDLTLAGAVSGEEAVIRAYIEQDGTGGHAITNLATVASWPDGITPTLDTSPGAVEVLEFTSIDGGVSWLGFHGATEPNFATPAIVLGTAAAAGSADTVIRSDATIEAFDTTPPVTQAFGDVAATGSSGHAARRDHVHGMPAAASGGSGSDHEHMIDVFNGDAATAAFEITDEPIDPEAVFAFVGGSWTAVTVSGPMNTIVTFGSAPGSGTGNVVIQYPAVAA